MNILQTLTCAYPQWPDGSLVDVTGQDFVDHLSIGASGWVGAWIAIGLTVVFGLHFPVGSPSNASPHGGGEARRSLSLI